MKVLLYQTGKTSFGYIHQGIIDYSKRITKYVPFEIITFPDVKYTKNQSVNKLKIKESENVIKKLKNTDYIILLDERGKNFNSVEFSEYLKNKLMINKQQLVFIIGGLSVLLMKYIKKLTK